MPLKIFIDFTPSSGALEELVEGTRGHELIFTKSPSTSVLVQAESDPRFAGADVAFGQPTLDMIEGAGNLKWIHVSSAGITRYDTPEFRGQMEVRKIPVTNSSSVYNEACALHALSFILAQARDLPRALNTRAAAGTETYRALREASSPLRGDTVLILGYGAIGRRLVELLTPLGMKIFAHRRKARGDEGVPVITETDLPGMLAQADHVVNILPDSSATRHYFNAARFATLKPGAIFYNIGRGSTVDQNALLETLQNGRLGAAWLDVTEPEPLPEGHPLLSEARCFITPHVAGGHRDETGTLVRHFLANLHRFTRGEALLDRVM